MSDYDYTLSAWAEDFLRALGDRPWIIRILIPLIFGKYAYSEFVGMIEARCHAGFKYFWGYSLQGQKYHQRHLPLKWWEVNECLCDTCKAKAEKKK